MNCNLKNKTVAMIALAFALSLAVNSVSFAAEENSAANQGNAAPSSVVENAANTVNEGVQNAKDKAADAMQNISDQEAAALADIKKLNSEIQQVSDELKDMNIENPIPEDAGAPAEANADATNPLLDVDAAQVDNELPIDNSDPFAADSPIAADFNDLTQPEEGENAEIPAAEAPKSPFEKFGNAILSKVDNSLFNQMSRIEKQNTLLNLEIKRETLKNQVLSLRQMRTKMLEEEEDRKRAREAKIKEEEIARQAKILEEERKLKEKEIELEKLRQAKVINDYMNEMLMMNQQWVEKNTKLQNRIHELEDERVELIDMFKLKMEDLDNGIDNIHAQAHEAADFHEKTVARLNEKIESLKTTIKDLRVELRESNLKIKELQKQLQEAAANPFKGTVVKDVTEEVVDYDDFDFEEIPDKEDKDISNEYSILEIIGRDDEIVAVLINKNEKKFIVHKGTVMKDGSVITSITEKYISFENPDGEKGYLYPGVGIMDYEPKESFDGTATVDEEPGASAKEVLPDDNSKEEQAKLSKKGNSAKPSTAQKPKAAQAPKKSVKAAQKPRNIKKSASKKSNSDVNRRVSPPSFGSGMFMD